LNGYLKFNELWNFVSYEYGGSIWQPILNTRSFEPRRDFADPEMAEGDRAKIRYRQNVEEMVGYIRGGIALRNNDQYWVGAMQLADTLFPPALRAVSVVTMDFPSPYYSGRLNESEGKSLMEQASEHAERLRKLGFNQVDISRKDFTEDDYVDYVHMSVAGGKKLAASLAPIIRDMAKTIGYIP
jgi:hypothetical protein